MKLTPEVQRALGTAERWEPGLVARPWGTRLVLTEQLDRKTYVQVDKAIQALGGKWDRGAKGHVFAASTVEVEAAIDRALCAGEVLTNQDWGFFPTPHGLAGRLVDLARIDDDMDVLEPSAGDGALAVRASIAAEDVRVTCVEIEARRAEELREVGYHAVHHADFLDLVPCARLGLFDRAVMNPPFGGGADVRHVLHALRFLKPGGRLAAICSAGVAFRKGSLYEELRARIAADGEIEALPEGSFKDAGTNCSTVMLAIDC